MAHQSELPRQGPWDPSHLRWSWEAEGYPPQFSTHPWKLGLIKRIINHHLSSFIPWILALIIIGIIGPYLEKKVALVGGTLRSSWLDDDMVWLAFDEYDILHANQNHWDDSLGSFNIWILFWTMNYGHTSYPSSTCQWMLKTNLTLV